MNFRRYKFFPSITSMDYKTYFNLSVGLFYKFFLGKGKPFLKTKSAYLVVSNFLKKILMFSGVKELFLIVKRKPLYFNEIMNSLNNPVIANYKNPFNKNENIDEFFFKKKFYFFYFIFIKSKQHGFMKTKKRGRIKRNVFKKLLKISKKTD